MRKHLSLFLTASFLVMGSSAMASSFQQDDDNDMVLDQSTNGQNSVQNSENQVMISSSSSSTAEPRAKRAKKENIEGLRETYEGFAYKELSRRVSKDPSQPMRGSVTLPTGDALEFEFDVFSASFDMVKKDVFSFLLVNDIPAFKALRQASKHFKTLSGSDDLRNLTWRIFAERTGDAAHFNACHAPLYKALPLHQLWYYLEKDIYTDALKDDMADEDMYWWKKEITSEMPLVVRSRHISEVGLFPLTTLQMSFYNSTLFPENHLDKEEWANLENLYLFQDHREDKIRHLEVGHLTGLKELCIGGTLVRSVGGLTKLTQLECLELSANHRLEVGPEIENLTNLWSLTLLAQPWNSALNLNTFTKLRYLSFENNKHVERLPDISGLVNLEVLNLTRSNIRTLPDLTPLTSLRQIMLADTPLGALISFRDE